MRVRVTIFGSGHGHSVHEVVQAAERVVDTEIATVERERRPGDPAVLIADGY